MKEKTARIIVIMLYFICVVLECIPGSVIFTTTVDQGQTKVYRDIAYISFSYFGTGILLPPIVAVFTVLLLVVGIVWLISGKERWRKELLEFGGLTLGLNVISMCFSPKVTIISILITAALLASEVVLILCRRS